MASLAEKTARWERERRKKLGLPEDKIVTGVICIYCNLIKDTTEFVYDYRDGDVLKGGCASCLNKIVADIPRCREVTCDGCNKVYTRENLGEIIMRSWNWRYMRYQGLCRSCVREGRIPKI